MKARPPLLVPGRSPNDFRVGSPRLFPRSGLVLGGQPDAGLPESQFGDGESVLPRRCASQAERGRESATSDKRKDSSLSCFRWSPGPESNRHLDLCEGRDLPFAHRGTPTGGALQRLTDRLRRGKGFPCPARSVWKPIQRGCGSGVAASSPEPRHPHATFCAVRRQHPYMLRA